MTTDGDPLLMTPGPTAVPAEVRTAMSRPIVNPDVDPEFSTLYRTLLEKLSRVYGTENDVLVLGGEGMLGLEASVASLIEPGDRVLCLANGIFGAGFADLVELHGGEAIVHEADPDGPFDPDDVRGAVESAGDLAAATMVHCETPTGLLNDLDGVLDVLEAADVLTIVDAVSSLGGTPVPVDRIDVCLGASQKCFSSPPGLTTLSVSDRAWERVAGTEQRSFYTSLEPWRDVDLGADDPVLLPYTHLISNLFALEASLDRILEEGREALIERHAAAAERCRARGRELGLEPFPATSAHSSPTVTAFELPGRARAVQRELADHHDVVVATSLGEYADDLLRIGHMGENARIDRVDRAMDALEAVLA